MPSPFPGMDPYLEAHWGDVHAALIIYAREALQKRLPGDLRARVEERVFVESDDAELRSVYPDIRVYERPPAREYSAPTAARGIAVVEPLVVHRKSEPVTETFIEIREAGSGGRVITVIELVSLSNKQPGQGRTPYLKKQAELEAGGVNSVEIDLLRSGERVTAAPPEMLPPDYRGPYRICVREPRSPINGKSIGRRSPNVCRRSPFRCDRPTPTCRSTCSRSSTAVTRREPTTTSTTRSRRPRR